MRASTSYAQLTRGQHGVAAFGETRFEHATQLRVRTALDETANLQVGDDAVHGLQSHLCPARQLRSTQPRRDHH